MEYNPTIGHWIDNPGKLDPHVFGPKRSYGMGLSARMSRLYCSTLKTICPKKI